MPHTESPPGMEAGDRRRKTETFADETFADNANDKAWRRIASLRRRMLVDALLLVGIAMAVCLPANDPANSVTLAISTICIGLLFFIIRRRNDLRAMIRANAWRDARSMGRGISFQQWRAGEPLPPWAER